MIGSAHASGDPSAGRRSDAPDSATAAAGAIGTAGASSFLRHLARQALGRAADVTPIVASRFGRGPDVQPSTTYDDHDNATARSPMSGDVPEMRDAPPAAAPLQPRLRRTAGERRQPGERGAHSASIVDSNQGDIASSPRRDELASRRRGSDAPLPASTESTSAARANVGARRASAPAISTDPSSSRDGFRASDDGRDMQPHRGAAARSIGASESLPRGDVGDLGERGAPASLRGTLGSLRSPNARAAPTTPIVNVTIGRIEIRTNAPVPAPPPKPAPPRGPRLTIDGYLAKRNGFARPDGQPSGGAP